MPSLQSVVSMTAGYSLNRFEKPNHNLDLESQETIYLQGFPWDSSSKKNIIFVPPH